VIAETMLPLGATAGRVGRDKVVALDAGEPLGVCCTHSPTSPFSTSPLLRTDPVPGEYSGKQMKHAFENGFVDSFLAETPDRREFVDWKLYRVALTRWSTGGGDSPASIVKSQAAFDHLLQQIAVDLRTRPELPAGSST
jgi:hypothetical protein